MLSSFHMILMYFSQANKAPARSLDACLGEGVMASMPAPPFFPRWPPSRSPIPPLTLKSPFDLCALAGGRLSNCPPKHWLRPICNRDWARMQMAAPRATICFVPSYESSAVAGRTRSTSVAPRLQKGWFPLPLAHFLVECLTEHTQDTSHRH